MGAFDEVRGLTQHMADEGELIGYAHHVTLLQTIKTIEQSLDLYSCCTKYTYIVPSFVTNVHEEDIG